MIHCNGVYLQVDLLRDVVAFYRDGKAVKIILNSGNEYNVNESISQLSDQFKEEDILQINPGTLVNLRTVIGFEYGAKDEPLQLIFKAPVQQVLQKHHYQYLKVTGKFIDTFTIRYPESVKKASNL